MIISKIKPRYDRINLGISVYHLKTNRNLFRIILSCLNIKDMVTVQVNDLILLNSNEYNWFVFSFLNEISIQAIVTNVVFNMCK